MTETTPQPSAPAGGGSGSVDQNKIFAIVGYIVPFLFFIPLVTDAKSNAFAKFHANQQLNLLLFWVIGQLVSMALMIVLIGVLLQPLVMIAGIVFMILGIINAANGKTKELPLIGKYQLIK